jgi:hypothetical protein
MGVVEAPRKQHAVASLSGKLLRKTDRLAALFEPNDPVPPIRNDGRRRVNGRHARRRSAL